METFDFKQKNKPAIQVTKEDLLVNILEFLRQNYPDTECILYEISRNGNEVTEGAAAVLALLRNPLTINYYNEIVHQKFEE